MNATTETLAARRDRAFGAGAPLFYSTPLHIVRGQGVELFDPEGRRYVDMYNNVPCVGHANPARRRGDGPPAGARSTSTAATCTKASWPSPSGWRRCTGPRSRA